jgi:hypothetical protein
LSLNKKIAIFFFFILISLGAIADSILTGPDRLVVDINAEFSYQNFDIKRFCRQFWEPNSLSICHQLPWYYAFGNSIKINSKFQVSNGPSGFFDFLNLAYICSSNNCRIGLDLQPVWSQFSNEWSKSSIYSGRLIAAQPLTTDMRAFYSKKMQDWFEKITFLFSIKKEKTQDVYFLNDLKTAKNVGFQFNPIVSGGSRGNYLVFVGQNLPPSYLLHELVHSYTSYPGEWWKGHGHFPHAILNEGLAVWVQLQEVWHDGIPFEKVGTLFCHDLQIASKNLNGNILRLFDNNLFRTFDKDGYHPSYLVGASVIHSLISRIQISGLKTLWNRIGHIHDPEVAALALSEVVSQRELLDEMNIYFQNLASDIQKNTNHTCLIEGTKNQLIQFE